MFKRKNKVVDETISNPSGAKVVNYSYKTIAKDRLKEVIAMIIIAFLWMMRLSFVPSLLLSVATVFATTTVPSIAAQIYGRTGLTAESMLADQFAFFYLPMITFVFIFGTVVIIGVCYTQLIFWRKCGGWLKIWYPRTGVKNPFKRADK